MIRVKYSFFICVKMKSPSCLLLSYLVAALNLGLSKSDVVKLILDTDMNGDVDDVGALCAAHGLVQLGEAEIVAVVHNVGYPRAIGAVSVINHYYGRDDIALGAFKGEFGRYYSGAYIDDLVDNFDSPVKHYDQVKEAVVVLREALAAAEDHSIVIASVGFMQNLAQLLQSPADEISSLSGFELVNAKVKSVFIMGGVYPESTLFSEYNFDCGMGFLGDTLECTGSAKSAVENMPPGVKMVFSGFEVGIEVMSGGALTSCAPTSSPCRQAYIDFNGEYNDRPSWDPLTLVAAVRSVEQLGCEETGYNGKNDIDVVGNNFWIEQVDGGSNQTYLLLNNGQIGGDVIDDLLCQDPNPTNPPPPPTTQHPPGTAAQIFSPLTSMCLHVHSNSDNPEDYTNVDVAPCDGSDRQKWSLSSKGEIIHLPSGKCLDADGNNDNEVELYSCLDYAWQKWDLRGNTFRNRGLHKCLDIKNCPDGNCEGGTDIWVYDCYGGENQNWEWNI